MSKVIIRLFSFCTMSLDKIPTVKIDPDGVFKYILIKVTGGGSERLIIRGYAKCHFHADILDLTETEEGSSGTKFKCLGGGRINHDSTNKNILVYGYSQGFGRADHQKTVDLLKGEYKDYSISYSNDGY